MTECIQCGFCCKVGPCAFGKWDYRLKRCRYLTEDNLCAKYDEIKDLPSARLSPAFGAGCSSSLFNEDREKKMKEIKETTTDV